LTASRTRFDTSINYYQVLNVAPGATAEDITRAYRALMRVTHPDNFQEPMERSRAEDRTKLINAAYAVLSRPEVRIAYDDQMRTTAVSDALMQRYTGNAPGRTDPLGTRPRSRSPGTVRAQRRAYNSAVRQLMLMAAAFALALMLLIFVFGLAGAMWNIAWGWIVSLFS
jgi:curved DNA-binding protein CbpA